MVQVVFEFIVKVVFPAGALTNLMLGVILKASD